jgi:hypothetical protein
MKKLLVVCGAVNILGGFQLHGALDLEWPFDLEAHAQCA